MLSESNCLKLCKMISSWIVLLYKRIQFSIKNETCFHRINNYNFLLVSTKWPRKYVKYFNCSVCVKSTMACLWNWTKPPSTCWESASPTSPGATPTWNRSGSWSTSEALLKLMDNVCPSPAIKSLRIVCARATLFALKIWSTKFSPWVVTSNTPPTSYGLSKYEIFNFSSFFLILLIFFYFVLN